MSDEKEKTATGSAARLDTYRELARVNLSLVAPIGLAMVMRLAEHDDGVHIVIPNQAIRVVDGIGQGPRSSKIRCEAVG